MKNQEVTFKELVGKLIKHYGVTTTKIIAIEELSELTKELTKDLRGGMRRELLIQELADVFINTEALLQSYSITEEEFENAIVEKMHRNLTRIKNKAELGEVMGNVIGKGGGTFL